MTDWFLREGGVVTEAAWDVADASPMHRANAYGKAWRGEDLTADEAAALAAAEGLEGGLAGRLSGLNLAGGDAMLGMIAHHRPDILRAVDALARDLADALQLPDFMAWSVLAGYTERAAAAVLADLQDSLPPFPAGDLAEALDAAEWEQSEEGQRAAAAMEPDGGPEGWSTIPPANPDHGCHPSRRPT